MTTSLRTSAEQANVGNARCQVSAPGQPTKEAGASNEAGRASASTTYLLHTIPPLLGLLTCTSVLYQGWY